MKKTAKKEINIYRLWDIDNNENLMYGTMADIKKYARNQITFKLPSSLLREQVDKLLEINMVAVDFLEEIGFKPILIYTVTEYDFLKSKKT